MLHDLFHSIELSHAVDVETRLDFDQKKQVANANGQGIFRIKVHIKNNMWYKDTEVFEKIASTFRFTGE